MFVKCLNGKSQIITLIGAILIIGVYSCKKQESEKEDVSLTMSVEQIMQEPSKEKSLLKDPVSLEEKLYKQTKIAFSSNRDGNVGFYVMNADGSEVKRITSNPIMEADPSWAVMEGDPSWSPFLVSEKETMEDEKWNPK